VDSANRDRIDLEHHRWYGKGGDADGGGCRLGAVDLFGLDSIDLGQLLDVGQANRDAHDVAHAHACTATIASTAADARANAAKAPSPSVLTTVPPRL
jgi:hypothetical protein